MIKIKQLKFPSFGRWCENGYEYEGKIGEYNVHIRKCVWSNSETVFGFAVSTDHNPLNMYANDIWYRKCHICWEDADSENKLKLWYNKSIVEFIEFWEKYIYETYFDNK